jgi:hypothetical protein
MLDSRRNIALACALSALAGYVDGIGFLHLGGLFVSFMSGNSTLRICCCGRRWWRVPCAVRSPITGSISPRAGLPPARRWR